MKNRFFFISLSLAFSALIMLSCKAGREKNTETKGSIYPKAELVANFEPYQNSASFEIIKLSIEGNIMIIDVEYSGGCEEHEFKLLGSEMIQKSMPPQRGIMLWHNNKGDSCRSIVNEQLKFDISAFAYEGGEIILKLDGWDPLISYTKAN